MSLGWRGTVFIVDDNFIGNKKNVRRLLPELTQWQEKHGHPGRRLSINHAHDLQTERILPTRSRFT